MRNAKYEWSERAERHGRQKPRGQRSSVAGATEIQWSEWDERHGRQSREGSGPVLREQPKQWSGANGRSRTSVGRCCAGLDFQPKLLRAREIAGAVDDKWHGSGYLSRSAQPTHALALAVALYRASGERHFRSCACVFFTGAIGSCCQQNLEQQRHRL